MFKAVLATAAILLCVSPAVAEPISISLGISALLGGIAIPVSVGTFVVNTAIGLALSVGLSFASKALMGQNGQQAITPLINAPEIRYNERQPTPSKRIIVGTAQVGGALFFEECKPPYLMQGFLFCARKISAVRKCWIGTNEVLFSDITPNTVLTPLLDTSGAVNYISALKLSVRLGEDDQAIDPLLATDYTNLSAEFRQRGNATGVLRYNYGGDYDTFTRLWGQVQKPNPLFLIDGVSCYDPRDETQDVDDDTTWKFTNNATLVQTYYLTQSFGGRIATSKIDWDKISESADFDDGVFSCLDGTVLKRHTIDGMFNLSQPPVDVLKGMLSANRGRVLESGGRVWVSSSQPKTPIATIYDGILVGAFDYRAAKPKRDLVNRCKCRFVAEDREYQIVDGPILSRTDLQTTDGEILDGTLDLPFTMDHRRAQRLQKAYLDSSRLGKTVTCQVDVSILAQIDDELVGNVVTVDSQLFSQANGTYMVTDVGFGQSYSSIELALVEYDQAIETAYDCNVDEQPFVLESLDVS